ncbi:hypothetical protein D3C86_1035990 [compost metagenome]
MQARHLGRERHDGAAPLGVARRGDVARGLVERVVDLAGLARERLAVDGDRILGGVGLGAQFAHHLAIDRHAPGEDQLLAAAPGRDPRASEDFLQTLG